MPTAITNTAFADGLADTIDQYNTGAITESAMAAAILVLLDDWTFNGVSNPQLAGAMSTTVVNWNTFINQYANWLAGTATGGYDSDGTPTTGVAPHGGYYPLTNAFGDTFYVACPAKMAAGSRKRLWIPPALISGFPGGAPTLNTINIAPSTVLTSLDYSATTNQYAQFRVKMPKNWDLGQVSAQVSWSHASTTTNFGVAWAVAAVAFSDGDAQGISWGTGYQMPDTGGVADTSYFSPESALFTVENSPSALDVVTFQIYRLPGDAFDTLAVPARLHGVTVHYTATSDTET